eukprot:m.104883 g.104883  ORF g.104883 m.104883 type:complete len:158 (+) comp51620_c0_seq2:57-530(+)
MGCCGSKEDSDEVTERSPLLTENRPQPRQQQQQPQQQPHASTSTASAERPADLHARLGQVVARAESTLIPLSSEPARSDRGILKSASHPPASGGSVPSRAHTALPVSTLSKGVTAQILSAPPAVDEIQDIVALFTKAAHGIHVHATRPVVQMLPGLD